MKKERITWPILEVIWWLISTLTSVGTELKVGLPFVRIKRFKISTYPQPKTVYRKDTDSCISIPKKGNKIIILYNVTKSWPPLKRGIPCKLVQTSVKTKSLTPSPKMTIDHPSPTPTTSCKIYVFFLNRLDFTVITTITRYKVHVYLCYK